MRRVILAIVSTAAGLVLLLTFKTHSTSAVNPPPAAIGSPNDSASAPVPAPASAPATAPSASSSSGGSTTSRTVTGAAASTIYGPVQVRITVRNGKITAAQAVVYPEDTPRDQQINAFAIPELNQEAVAASSARIDMVSGATYTSQGYLSSLQSALDQAGR